MSQRTHTPASSGLSLTFYYYYYWSSHEFQGLLGTTVCPYIDIYVMWLAFSIVFLFWITHIHRIHPSSGITYFTSTFGWFSVSQGTTTLQVCSTQTLRERTDKNLNIFSSAKSFWAGSSACFIVIIDRPCLMSISWIRALHLTGPCMSDRPIILKYINKGSRTARTP